MSRGKGREVLVHNNITFLCIGSMEKIPLLFNDFDGKTFLRFRSKGAMTIFR